MKGIEEQCSTNAGMSPSLSTVVVGMVVLTYAYPLARTAISVGSLAFSAARTAVSATGWVAGRVVEAIEDGWEEIETPKNKPD